MFSNPEENEREDYFNDESLPEEPKKEPKKPELQPDDPKYWEQEESEWKPIHPRRRRVWLWLVAFGLGLGLCIGFYLRYFSPYITEAVQYGYIEGIEYRGTLFHTYEGVMIPYRELMDTTRIYSRDFIFTAADKDVAIALKNAEKTHRPVRVEYERYHATLPWRGSSKIIVTKVDTVDARRILPPEFAPRRYGDDVSAEE